MSDTYIGSDTGSSSGSVTFTGYYAVATRRRTFYERGGRRRPRPGSVRWTWGAMPRWRVTA